MFPLTAFLFVQGGFRKGFRIVLLIWLGFALAFAPWVARNLSTLGVAGDQGLITTTLLHGMYPNFMYENDAESYGSPYRFDPRANEIGRSPGLVLKEIKRRFMEEPGNHLRWFLIGKPCAFWSWNEVQGSGDIFVFPVEADTLPGVTPL